MLVDFQHTLHEVTNTQNARTHIDTKKDTNVIDYIIKYQNSFPGVNFTQLNATPSAESFKERRNHSTYPEYIQT